MDYSDAMKNQGANTGQRHSISALQDIGPTVLQ
jgi:hypothetical protein